MIKEKQICLEICVWLIISLVFSLSLALNLVLLLKSLFISLSNHVLFVRIIHLRGWRGRKIKCAKFPFCRKNKTGTDSIVLCCLGGWGEGLDDSAPSSNEEQTGHTGNFMRYIRGNTCEATSDKNGGESLTQKAIMVPSIYLGNRNSELGMTPH